MKLSLMALALGAALAGQVAQACLAPRPAPALPAGLDGKLPTVNPDKLTVPTPVPTATPAPNTTPTPTPTPTPIWTCSTGDRYSNTATMSALSDADTDAVYGKATVPTAAAWNPSTAYIQGDLVSYEGITYKAKWWTQNEKPGQAWGAWEEQSALSGPQAWSNSKVYNAGDLAIFNGRLYQARWWTQNNQPDQAGSPWEDKGSAPVSPMRPALFSTNVTQQASGDVDVQVNLGSFIYYTKYVYRVNASCSVNILQEGEQPANMVPPRTERWEVHVDGKVVATQQGPYLMPVPGVAPPAPQPIPRNPDGSCSLPEGTVVNSFNAPRGGVVMGSLKLTAEQAKGNYLSVWLCNGDLCRPSSLLRAYKFNLPYNYIY
ncbi:MULTISPECIES: carbohydrate-binding protein [Deefgea]|uniref:Chitin-binding type-3 domain-containing protein n=1 Tax=Deefgea chitinilytica TaxID=570276 RepID=A0ABS2CEQ9_9NEIS|nr:MULTISPECIES: carbohydrate-binding protein [Deefgea]MBM5572641.1 hypothetical protein [Deefgea chitinilytica]MBM9889877.1 hypothetical protein [Deefgea sp. CFH1-16]